jgi:hypothetical protein
MNRTSPVPGLVLTVVALLIGILVVTLEGLPLAWPGPDRPHTIAPDAASPPRVMPLVTDASPVFGRRGASHAAVCVCRVISPRDHLALADCDLDDDDTSALAMQTAGALRPPRPGNMTGPTGVTHTRRWRSRYLVRPQLLTRL